MCDESEIYVIFYYTLFSCSIPTVISCLFMIFVYLKYNNLRGLSLRIVFWMSINDLLRSGFYMIPPGYLESYVICTTYGFIINVTFTNNAIWAIYIVITLRKILFSFAKETKTYFSYFLFTTLFIVPLYHIGPLLTNSYGNNRGICTFKNDDLGIIWRSIQMGIIIAAGILSIVIYINIYIKTKRFELLSISDLIFQKGMIFAIITILTSSFIITFRYLEVSFSICNTYIFGIISCVAISLHGFFNFLAVMSNNNIRRTLIDTLKQRTRSASLLDFIQ